MSWGFEHIIPDGKYFPKYNFGTYLILEKF